MAIVGNINIKLVVPCALCHDEEEIEVPLSQNIPSLTFEISHCNLMNAIDEAGMIKTRVGWMHIPCSIQYHKRDILPKPIQWPPSDVQPEGSTL